MTITTEDGIIAGLLPSRYFTKANGTGTSAYPSAIGLSNAGLPAAFVPATPGLTGATVDGTTSTLGGTFPFLNPASGNSYLSKWACGAGTAISGVSLFDLLWYNTGISATTTTAQTVSSVALPARDSNGSTNGVGVTAWLYCSAATGNLAAISNTTISYTNAAGTAGLTGSLLMSWPISAPLGTFVPFTWNGGDTGVRSIQSITLGTSYVSGTINIVMIREVSYLGTFQAMQSGQILDWAQCGFPQLYNGSALSFWLSANGAYGIISGEINISQG